MTTMLENKSLVTPVILSGGSGARLWPLSRSGFPKQFLTIFENLSPFQNTLLRCLKLSSNSFELSQPIVVTSEEHRFIAKEQIREVTSKQVTLILEPFAKNTAPALTLAALQALSSGEDPILVVTPSDHNIADTEIFKKNIQAAIKVAELGSIVTLGSKPLSPETGFGYIKHSDEPDSYGQFEVLRFIEKPNKVLAKTLLEEGSYFWNLGIFVLKASVWLNSLETFRKDILDSSKLAFDKSKSDNTFIRPKSDLFKLIPSESIDYAVIEKCPGSKFKMDTILLEAPWNDLGTWDAVWNFEDKNDSGNVITGDVVTEMANNNLILSNNRLVAALGVDNLAIIETSDAVLVANLQSSQDIKKIVDNLSLSSRDESVFHRKVFRPWGWFDVIDVGKKFKVKRILVKPYSSLSLQKHKYRAEHWVVIKGEALVVKGDNEIKLVENHSIFIEAGEIHRLTNPSSTDLEIIEVQSGSYLGEDDIIRIDDSYGR